MKAFPLLLAAVPVTAHDVEPLPCAPGIVRPRETTPVAAPKSKELTDAEKEVALLRERARKFRAQADEAVLAAFRREKEQVARRFQAKIETIAEGERSRRDLAIGEFRDHLARRPDSPSAAEVRFRLAELEFEDATDRYLVARRGWEAAIEKIGPKEELPPAPRPDYRKAIAAYRELLGKHPDYAMGDGARYMIAFCLGEQGDARGARDEFEELAKVAPKSRYAPEAWLRVGEFHFDRSEIDPAIAAYRKALESPDSAWHDEALYKLAWSWYRRADADHPHAWAEAASTFARLVDTQKDSPLRQEAIQYLAVIYADHGGLPAVRYATSGKPWAAEVIRALAQVWHDQGNWYDAAETWHLALDADPFADDAPLWLDRRATALWNLGRFEEAAVEREKLHKNYGAGSEWQVTKASKRVVADRALDVAEPALLASAIWRHQRAQETGEEADYARAAELYDEYLKRYPGRSAAYDIAFYRGECLYYAGRFTEAAKAYSSVLEVSTDYRWHAEAAFSRLKAWEKLVGEPMREGSDPPADAAEKPLTDEERALVTAAEEFTCVAPTDWRVPEALYRAAQVYYATRRLPAARERAEAVVKAVPREDLAAWSAALVVDAWRAEGNWVEVEQAAVRFGRLAPGRTADVRDSVKANMERVALEAGYQIALARKNAGDAEGAARAFLALADRAPKSELADEAIWAAAESWEQAGLSAQAAQAFHRLAREYPTAELAQSAAFRRARNLERILEVETAAKAYVEFATRYRFHQDSRAALWNAAVLQEAAGRHADAAAGWESWAKEDPTHPDTFGARVRAAESWERAGKPDKALRAWASIANDPATDRALRVEALAGMVRAEKARRGKGGAVEAKEAIDEQLLLAEEGNATPESARAAASLALEKAAAIDARMRTVRVDTSTRAKLQASLGARSRLLDATEKAWLEAASLGDPEAATEALHRIGAAYESFASAARDAAKGNQQLADYAVPLEQKARAAYDAAVRAAEGAHVETEWTWRSRAALGGAPRRDALPFPESETWALPAPQGLPEARFAGPVSQDIGAQKRFVEAFAVLETARRRGDRDAWTAAEKAMAEAVTALAGAPKGVRAAAWTDLGIARAMLTDAPGALVAFRGALAADEESAPAMAGQVWALAVTGAEREAIDTARAWLRKHPADVPVRVNLSGALRLAKDAPAALAMAIEALAGDARNGRARRAAIASALAAKKPDLALFAARHAVQIAPDDPEMALALGLALREAEPARTRGRAAGRAVLVEATARFPEHARLAHAAGAALAEDGDPASAVALLEPAATRSATAGAWIALAGARRRAGRANEAVIAGEGAARIAPDDPAVLKNLGLARLDAGDTKGAADAFTRYIDLVKPAKDDPARAWLKEAQP